MTDCPDIVAQRKLDRYFRDVGHQFLYASLHILAVLIGLRVREGTADAGVFLSYHYYISRVL